MVKSITVDGEIMKVPTAVHIDGMVYYNMDVAKAAGVDPAAWTSLDAMFADFDKVKAAGYIPLAIGGQQWQVGYLTHALAATTGGPEFFSKIYGETPDPAAIDSPEIATPSNGCASSRRRPTRLGQPPLERHHQHGDHRQGADADLRRLDERRMARRRQDPRHRLRLHPDPRRKVARRHRRRLGPARRPTRPSRQAELDFAAVVLDPNVQGEFAKAKGSTPTRLDAPQDSLDACSHEVLASLEDPAHQVPNPHNTVDADWQSSIWDVVFNFWSDSSMTVDDAIEQMKDNYQVILG